jgi:exodeoxyribonuclease III
MKVATWNVNSIRIRLPRLITWLSKHQPDVLCLQETKTTDEQFPFDDLAAVGYQSQTWGQKTYNGVALLSRQPLNDISRGFAGTIAAPDGDQARCIAGTWNDVRVISVYVPNGSEVGSEKFYYKLDWLAQLETYMQHERSRHPCVLLCGDMNVAPTDADVHDPAVWRDSVLCSEQERAALRNATVEMNDLFRQLHPEPGVFSWWDYRGISFFKNLGLRIDHIYGSQAAAERCHHAEIDRSERKGQQPSDHAPVIIELR